jgi:hypothetical protein
MTMKSKQSSALDQAPDIVITRFVLEAFRGVDLLELELTEHPRGVEFAGSKAIGKTSSIRGLETIMWGAGIDKSTIKVGHDKARASLSFVHRGQEMTATRTISKSGTKVELVGADGIPLPKAVEQLRAIFGQGIGSGGRDPLKLYSADKETLRKILLQASPCAVTGEMLTRWCEEDRPWNVDGHGQEVLGRVKDNYFSLRTTAGQECDRAEEEVKTRDSDVAKLRSPDLPSITAAAAQTHVAAAERELAVLHDRRRQSEKREAEAEGTRAKIAELRSKAETLMDKPEAPAPDPLEMAAAEAEAKSAEDAVAAAELRLARAKVARNALIGKANTANAIAAQVRAAIDQANELEAAIAHTLDGDGDPIAVQVAAAEESLEAARQLVAKATQADNLRAAEAKAVAARDEHQARKSTWEKLDRIVKRLTTEAPAELAKQNSAIPGLEILPKSILWNGHDLDLMSDGEKLEFAVDVVKRTATGAKVMVIDKLEHLPPSLRPKFVRSVLEGGWVLFATLVQDPIPGKDATAMEIVDCYRLAQKAA